ncbi:MAG: hypothetical protein EBU04_09010 [Verrucomicrobia bacterium]|nr:hypothetical protein [Verrucomicrobiota bacterium]
MFLEHHAEVRRVGRIFLYLTEVRHRAEVESHGRVIARDEFIRRIFFDPGHDLIASLVERIEAGLFFRGIADDTEGV